MRRLLALGGAVLSALALVVVPANPAAAAVHTVEITGHMRVVDDDVFGDVVATHPIRVAVLVSEAVPDALKIVRTCTGGEVQIQLNFSVTLDPSGSVLFNTAGIMHEGTSCGSDDIDDYDGFEVDVPAGQSVAVSSASTTTNGAAPIQRTSSFKPRTRSADPRAIHD